MKLSILRNTIIIIAFMVLAGGVGYTLGEKGYFRQPIKDYTIAGFRQALFNTDTPSAQTAIDFSQFWEVWSALEDKYYDSSRLNPTTMVNGAISGLVASLHDPWTVFLPPDDNKRAKEDLNGSFEGVGIQLGYKNNQLSVIAPLRGLPAEQAGILAGDLILKIKDEVKDIDVNTSTITIYQAVDYIRGPKGTSVELTLQHEDSDEPYTVSVKRDTIMVPSVELSFGFISGDRWQDINDYNPGSSQPTAAWLKLNRFGDNTLSEWEQAVSRINTRYQDGEIAGLVLDIRNNPGGYLSGAVSLASEFISKGVVVKQENADGSVEEYAVNRKGQLLDIPLVVLIDKGSASASEILAGALRYHQRAILVGENTFGKGTIQEALELDSQAGLHITTAKWLLPDGEWLKDNEGLAPDITVTNPEDDDTIDLQLVKAVEKVK